MAVQAILQSPNADRLCPWSFLHPHLQCHGCAMPQCGVDAWHVRRFLWTSSWKWNHGTARSGMPSFLCVKLGDSSTTIHGKLHRALGDDTMSRAQASLWQNPCWSLAAQRTDISNTDSWQHSTGKRTCSVWSKINSQNDFWWSEHEPGNRSFDADWWTGDDKNVFQDGSQESQTATAGCAVEYSF